MSKALLYTWHKLDGISDMQESELRKKLNIEESAQRLARFFGASTELMKVMARACGHNHLNQFNTHDVTTWKRDMADLSGIQFGGMK